MIYTGYVYDNWVVAPNTVYRNCSEQLIAISNELWNDAIHSSLKQVTLQSDAMNISLPQTIQIVFLLPLLQSIMYAHT